jgi:hypothetical protein
MHETVSHNGRLVAILEVRKFIVAADVLNFNGTAKSELEIRLSAEWEKSSYI